MDIAALSIGMSRANVMDQASSSIMKMAMNSGSKTYDVKALIEDSIRALESVENALNKTKDDGLLLLRTYSKFKG